MEEKLKHIKQPDDQHMPERLFETFLWNGRWTVLIAVIGSMATATAMFYIAAVDVYRVGEMVTEYAWVADVMERKHLRADAVGHIVEVIDGFLLAIVLLIFAFGLYELYISKIDRAYGDEAAKHMLSINNLDDLKSRLGKVILMILIVKFFEVAISMEFSGVLDLVWLSVAIVMISLSLFMAQVVEGGLFARRKSDHGGGTHPMRRREDAPGWVDGGGNG